MQQAAFELTGMRSIFRDGQDFFKKETKLKAVDYFNDGLIAMEEFEDRGPTRLPSNMICPTVEADQVRDSLSKTYNL